jgi:DNA-binding transcriptional ArsR family regulator
MAETAAISRIAIALDEGRTADLAEMFRLLGDSTRLAIVIACLDGPRAVAAIAEQTGASPSLVSHHLRLLRAARILRAERRGKQVFYNAADDHIRCVLADMIEHVTESHGEAHGDAHGETA